MKIKKVEIQGFKSFIDKTVFTFPKGVTVVVGPNGCGKSNIVDAIRWVLGEQNARHLRGRLMEDIIFAGSENRKQIGMAEVVLTLANEDGIVPQEYVNFPEIEISRKLFRSGESEYYINRVESRLKDIVELFTDTGIGTRAYSIIEQGQVGWLVTAKPEERRVLFEEAAGINKYKHRKDAAVRRLEATKENLTRVSDIINEVKRQLNSLNRQAKKAERYKVLRDELKDVELFLASIEYVKLEDNKKEAGLILERLKDKEIEISAGINQKEALLEELRARLLKEDEELREIKSALLKVGDSIQARERSSELNKIRIQELKRNEERLLKEIEELLYDKQKAGEELAQLKNSLEEVSNAIKIEEGRLNEEEGIFSATSVMLSQKDKELKDKRDELTNVMLRISQIKNAVNVCMRDEDAFRLKIGKLEMEKGEIEKIISQKEKIISSLKESHKSLDSIKQEFKDKEESIIRENKAVEDELNFMDAEQKSKKEALAVASSRLKTLQEFEDSLEGFQEGVRAILKNKKGEGVHGILAEFIETSPEYEKAVESVLGEKLKYAVVEGLNDSILAVEYLKTNELGKGSFVPIAIKKHGNTAALLQNTNADNINAEPLLNHVRARSGYSPIINYLLSDCLVAKNLNDAANMWNLNGIDKTIVTMDGEIIDACGIVTGGNSRENTGGILQRKREIKELSSNILDLEQRLIEIDKNILDRKDRVSLGKKEFEGIRALLHSKDIELTGLEGSLKQEESEFLRLGDRLNMVDFEIDDAKRQLTDIINKKAELIKERGSFEDSRNHIEETVNVIEQGVSALLKNKESISLNLTEIKIKIASLKERLDNIEYKQKEKGKFIEGAGEKIDAKRREIGIGADEIQSIESNLNDMQKEILDLLKEKDDIHKIEVIKEEELNGTRDAVKGIEDAIKSLRHEIGVVHEDVNKINLELNGLLLKSNHLLEKIMERYSVRIDEYKPSEELSRIEKGAISARCDELKMQIDGLGEVSLSALEEYAELERRHQFLLGQEADLTNSMETLKKAINSINRTTRQRFIDTFDAISAKFQEVFPVFFPGGRAEIRLVDEEDILESGIEIAAQPQGKRLQSINLLSGGEKAMTATTLIFSIFLIKPSPFCLLDEVDAPLDDANINRFNAFLKEMAKKSQFILITHNKGTMEIADTIFGITMEEPGVSKVVSVNLSS